MMAPWKTPVKVIVCFFCCFGRSLSLQLTTKATVQGIAPADLHAFLSTPTNWPKIVASSQSVRPTAKGNRVDKPLAVGEEVDEIFGLPPILPLSVRWVCERSEPSNGVLEFHSPDGLRGIAKDCRMKFAIESGKEENRSSSMEGSVLELKMEFEPLSPIALLATPVLTVDNALALKVLLPRAV